jgi:uncharacterized phage protein (TIGR02218 family)
MTFATYEESQESSQPIELYEIIVGTDVFRWTSAEDEVTAGGSTYTPEPGVRRTRISQNPAATNNEITITVGGSNDFAQMYVNVVPGQPASVTIRRVQRPDFPGPEVITLFEGKVHSVNFKERALEADIVVQPQIQSRSREIPRFLYQGLCNNVLYDSSCKVDDTDAAFRHTGTVSAVNVDGTVLTVTGVSGFGAGWFDAGFIEVQDDARMILSSSGNDLTLLLPFPFTVTGSMSTVFAGCDLSITTCDTKFFTTEDASSNVLNFGGFQYVPSKNPFETGL